MGLTTFVHSIIFRTFRTAQECGSFTELPKSDRVDFFLQVCSMRQVLHSQRLRSHFCAQDDGRFFGYSHLQVTGG